MTARTARRPRRPASPAEDEQFEDDNDNGGDEPTSRRSSSRPARRAAPSRRAAEDDDEPKGRRNPRAVDDDEDKDDKRESVGGGWGTWRQKKAEASDFADEFKVSEYKTKYLIMFLDQEPFATYNEHWIDDMPKGKKKSYICIGKKDCPLCKALGEKPSPRAVFNVLEFIDPDEDPVLKVWVCGSGIVQEIEPHAEDPGLEENYFVTYKTKSGKSGPTTYTVNHIKARDVKDDWNIEPLTDDEIAEFSKEKYGKGYVKMPTRASLQEVADEVLSWD